MAMARKGSCIFSVRLLGASQNQLVWTSVLPSFSVPRRGYWRPGQPRERKWLWQRINFDFDKGVDGVRKHLGLLKDEFLQRWVGPEGKPLLNHMLEQTRVLWEFRGPEDLSQWLVSSDREIGGRSEAYLKLGRNNTTCLLYGTLCSTPPRDGETRYSGYCSVRSQPPRVSLTLKSHLQLQNKIIYCRSLQRYQPVSPLLRTCTFIMFSNLSFTTGFI